MTIHKVGIDIGNSSVKFCSDMGFGEIPKWRSRGQTTRIVADDNAKLSTLRFNGEDLILGDEAVLGQGFIWKADEEKADELNIPFILLALARQGITRADIVIGLPVSTSSNPKKVEAAKSIYSGLKQATINGRDLTFDIHTNVLAEPLGTYLSLVLNEDLRYQKTSPWYADQVAIVDIGHRTVDIVILAGGQLAATKNSSMSGMIRLFDKVKADVEADHGKLRANEETRIHHQIIHNFGTAQLKVNGDFVRPDIWKRISQYKAQIARDITDEISHSLSEIRPDRVLLTGGGAQLLKDELMTNNRHFSIHPNPRFSNVIGFYRAAKMMPVQERSSHATDRDSGHQVQSR